MNQRRLGYQHVEEWIKFVPMGTSASGKTEVWYVVNTREDGDPIGIVKWSGSWRKYVYHTGPSYYDWDCLRLIADFCETKTNEHMEGVRDGKKNL